MRCPASLSARLQPEPITPPQPRDLGYGRLAAWLSVAGLLATLGYSVNLIADESEPRDLLFRYSTAVSSLVAYGILLVPLLLIIRGLPARDVVALRPPKAWSIALYLGCAILIADSIFSFLYDWLLGPFDEGALAEFWDSSRVPQFLANFVVIAVVAPIFEEFMYRGVGYGLLERFGTGTAIVVTGVFFGLAHGYVYVLPLFAAYGVALGWLRSRTGSIYPGMLVHGATNASALIFAVAFA
jgi:uncharacterized protein